MIVPSQEELIAFQVAKSEVDLDIIGNKVARFIGADEVCYNDNVNLAKGIGLKMSELCFSCSSGDYTPLGIKPDFGSRYQINDKIFVD